MTLTVRWFRNAHEHRNYWLRFGLMRLHRKGIIRYIERPLENCTEFGFHDDVAQHEHRHTSVVSVEVSAGRVRCIIDSEDSFLCMAGIIHYADVYFCSGFNAEFFQRKMFSPPYPWLNPHEQRFYEQRAQTILEAQGKFFDRVRPFVPIAPDLGLRRNQGKVPQRIRNLHHKLSKFVNVDQPWWFEHADFEERYKSLQALRNRPARFDVVLLDTLWGWPRHRLALHSRLGELANSGREVHSRLNWAPPSQWDGSDIDPLSPSEFPMIHGSVSNYEEMLASSRMAVFASGFHWGWRNIMTLSLMLGLPIFADRLFLQPWFSMDRFLLSWNEDSDWRGIEAQLNIVTDDDRSRIAAHNQAAFDALLAPEKVAEYFIGAALGGSFIDDF